MDPGSCLLSSVLPYRLPESRNQTPAQDYLPRNRPLLQASRNRSRLGLSVLFRSGRLLQLSGRTHGTLARTMSIVCTGRPTSATEFCGQTTCRRGHSNGLQKLKCFRLFGRNCFNLCGDRGSVLRIRQALDYVDLTAFVICNAIGPTFESLRTHTDRRLSALATLRFSFFQHCSVVPKRRRLRSRRDGCTTLRADSIVFPFRFHFFTSNAEWHKVLARIVACMNSISTTILWSNNPGPSTLDESVTEPQAKPSIISKFGRLSLSQAWSTAVRVSLA